jgi:undecaprenyl-diphosphatase
LKPLWQSALASGAAVSVLWWGGGWVCPDSACTQPAIDGAGLMALQAIRTPWLDDVFRIITGLGSLVLLLPLALLFAWYQRACGRQALFLPVVLLSATAICHIAKWWVDRPRPELFPSLVAIPWDASFPSAHTMQACAMLLGLSVHPGLRPSLRVGVAALVLVGLVAVSRVYLQVHFPSDVLVGAVAAMLWVWAVRALPVWQGGLDEK